MARHHVPDTPRSALGKHGGIGILVARLWDAVRSLSIGDPAPHHLTHMVGGTDQFPAPDAPPTVLAGGTASAGSGPGFMRSDARLVGGVAAPANPTGAAAAVGSAPTFLRSDSVTKQGIVTTKGDLLGHSTVPARIPVGPDGQVLTADSTKALGVKWSASRSPVDGSDVDRLEDHLLRQSIESYALRNVLATTFR